MRRFSRSFLPALLTLPALLIVPTGLASIPAPPAPKLEASFGPDAFQAADGTLEIAHDSPFLGWLTADDDGGNHGFGHDAFQVEGDMIETATGNAPFFDWLILGEDGDDPDETADASMANWIEDGGTTPLDLVATYSNP